MKRDPGQEADGDVPDAQRSADKNHDPITPSCRKHAAASGQLHPREEKDDAEYRCGEQLKERIDRIAEEQGQGQKYPAKNDDGAAGFGTEGEMGGHATGTVAHRNAPDGTTEQVHDAGGNGYLPLRHSALREKTVVLVCDGNHRIAKC